MEKIILPKLKQELVTGLTTASLLLVTVQPALAQETKPTDDRSQEPVVEQVDVNLNESLIEGGENDSNQSEVQNENPSSPQSFDPSTFDPRQ